jgi:hypothetical protein
MNLKPNPQNRTPWPTCSKTRAKYCWRNLGLHQLPPLVRLFDPHSTTAISISDDSGWQAQYSLFFTNACPECFLTRIDLRNIDRSCCIYVGQDEDPVLLGENPQAGNHRLAEFSRSSQASCPLPSFLYGNHRSCNTLLFSCLGQESSGKPRRASPSRVKRFRHKAAKAFYSESPGSLK